MVSPGCCARGAAGVQAARGEPPVEAGADQLSAWCRNVLLFPMGNSNGQANDMVSVYLNYGDQKAVEGWHVCAQFALAISNPNDPTVYIQSRTSPPSPP